DDLPQLFAAVLHLRLLVPRTGLPLVPALVLDPDGADELTAQRPGALSVISSDHLDSRWCETRRLECRHDRARCRASGSGTAETCPVRSGERHEQTADHSEPSGHSIALGARPE